MFTRRRGVFELYRQTVLIGTRTHSSMCLERATLYRPVSRLRNKVLLSFPLSPPGIRARCWAEAAPHVWAQMVLRRSSKSRL